MIALDLITEEILPLEHTDTGEMALQWMNDYKTNHLSVLKHNNFVGVVTEDDLLSQTDLSKPLTELFDHLPRPYVLQSTHIFNVLVIAADDHLSIIPVLDENETYLGDIKATTLIHRLASTGSMREQGGIIVLEMSETDYSLAQIAQIIESENAKILSSYITSNALSKKLELTLKINRIELGVILKALERYDYFVKFSFQKDSYHDDLKDRYDELMKYLNI
ncbi:MAG: CBS domain-containing protein [Brumimicrobium sp.]